MSMPVTPTIPGQDAATFDTAVTLLNSFAHVLVVSFVVAVLSAPLLRRVAFRYGIVDRPDAKRKLHDSAVPYLGGIAVFLAVIAGIAVSIWHDDTRVAPHYLPVGWAVIVGMVAIVGTGLADDVWHWDPRLKVAGQLVAAAALTLSDIGTPAIKGALSWVPDSVLTFSIAGMPVSHWIGTAVVAVFVLGACNSANLIDGLDGLLSGVVAIAALAMLVVALLIVPFEDTAVRADQTAAASYQAVARQFALNYARANGGDPTGREISAFIGDRLKLPNGYTFDVGRMVVEDHRGDPAYYESRLRGDPTATVADIQPIGFDVRVNPDPAGIQVSVERRRSNAAASIILALALIGAVVGFLPHNLKPASIFLGDCGSLLLGYLCAVIMLLFGDRGYTHLVLAGLIIFAVPVMDTILAIVRRRLAGVPMSAADDQHLHHQLRRALGGVAKAVFAMYGIGLVFAVLGVGLAAGVIIGGNAAVRVLYAISFVFFTFVAVIAVKAARREQWRRAVAARPAEAVGDASADRGT